MKISFWNLLLVVVGSSAVSAADLSSSGDWIESINAASLAAGAGSDIRCPLESVAGATVLSVANASGAWHVRARLGPGQWNPQMTVWVKRTSDGSGSGTIAGGAAYVALGASDVEIFTGTAARTSISLQFKITGLTRRVTPSTYNSSIIFTVQ